MKKIGIILNLLISVQLVMAQTNVVNLWEGYMPNYKKSDAKEIVENRNICWIENVQTPTLEIFLPSKANINRMAVLICPGGGYNGVAYDWEGTDYAKWFNSIGITAFVLKYRMPQSESVIISYRAPIQDAQRAMRYIRFFADEFNIEKNMVGIIGSSAGGHLASTLGTHLNENYYQSIDSIDNEDFSPNFMMLLYPVISMKNGVTHNGSRNALLGKAASDELIQKFSNELNVNENTPPTFIVHSGDDDVVPVQNSILIYQALVKNGIKTTMHLYPDGGHGYSLGINKENTPKWSELATEWLLDLKNTFNSN